MAFLNLFSDRNDVVKDKLLIVLPNCYTILSKISANVKYVLLPCIQKHFGFWPVCISVFHTMRLNFSSLK